jgi:3-oxoacyl-(acyl-carrier-protein) synthase
MNRVFVTGTGRVSPPLDGSGLKPDTLLGGLLSGRVAAEAGKDEPRLHALARLAADQALGMAPNLERVAAEDKAVFVSSSKGGMDGFPDAGPWLWKLLTQGPGQCLNAKLGWLGGGRNTPLACATGAYSMGLAYESLHRGRLKAALAGASEASLTPLVAAAFNNLGALSKGTDYAGPFDLGRNGFVLAEGAGVLLLESEDSLRVTGHRPLAELLAWDSLSDGHHMTAPEPEGRQAARCLRRALDKAGLREVAYVNAHGTATPSGDLAEAKALRVAFGNGAGPRVSSLKGALGHTLGAAGAIGAVATVEALNVGRLPGNLRCRRPMPELADWLALEEENLAGDSALSLSMGFGGHNVALVFRKP